MTFRQLVFFGFSIFSSLASGQDLRVYDTVTTSSYQTGEVAKLLPGGKVQVFIRDGADIGKLKVFSMRDLNRPLSEFDGLQVRDLVQTPANEVGRVVKFFHDGTARVFLMSGQEAYRYEHHRRTDLKPHASTECLEPHCPRTPADASSKPAK